MNCSSVHRSRRRRGRVPATSSRCACRRRSSAANVERGRRHAERHGGAEDGDLPLVAGHDRRLAAQRRASGPGRLASTVAISGVVALVLGPAGDVLDGAVGVVGVDGELLLVLPVRTRCSGKTRDLRDGRVGRARRRACRRRSSGGRACTRRSPTSIFLPPPWATRAGRLQQEQARVRGGAGRAAGRGLPSPASCSRAPARSRAATGGSRSGPRVLPWQPPRVAAELGEDRHDLVGEVDRQRRLHASRP